MTSFIVKLISIPTLLIIVMYVWAQVDYRDLWQPIIIAILLIVVGLALEYFILREDTLGLSLGLDFASALIIIWVVSNFMQDARVTFFAALVLSVLISMVEYFLHRYLVGAEKVRISD